ncbi:unnamed protein product [Vicia faba]|uniref:Reverse transcriptase domain-containing protein n=1 Tax=Vicia faba TaxID=3906 RepID=A0AAV0ZDJ1_VICFA|nr:unnamed protein product [Vicia faba]
MSPWKAPGPDGFPARFYHKPSDIMHINKTDICLIPKVNQPQNVSQFCLISLCNAVHKVLRKILVNRLTFLDIIMHAVSKPMLSGMELGVIFLDPKEAFDKEILFLPYLFVLCMEKLSHLILKAMHNKEWKTLQFDKEGSWLSYLMFVDDLLLIGETNEAQMECVMRILHKFGNMSGEEVNKDKTCIMFSKNVQRGLRNKLI